MQKFNFIQEAHIDLCWIIFPQFSTYRQAWKNILSRTETAEDSEKKQTEIPQTTLSPPKQLSTLKSSKNMPSSV